MKGSRLDPIRPRKDTRYVEEDDHLSDRRVNDWVRRYNLQERSDPDKLSIERDFGYSKYSGQPRIAGDQGRNPYYAYPDEGMSSRTSGPVHGYGEKMWNNSIPNKPNSEQDQVEIMRTLDELKDQLNRYYGAMDKPRLNNERAFPDRYPENIHIVGPVYPQRHDLAAFEDQFHAQMYRKAHNRPLPHEYDLGRRMDNNQFARNPQISFDCVNPKDFLSANLNRIGSPLRLGPHNSSPHDSDYALSRDVRPHERWTGGPESDGDSLSGPRRAVIRRKNEQHCRSIAGGAPFIGCYNCYELLKLPRNLMKGKSKLQCGACSFIIDVQIEKKRVIIGGPKESNLVSSEIDKDLHGSKPPKNGSGDFSDSGSKSDHSLKNSGQKTTLEDQELKLSSSEKKQSVSSCSADKSDLNLNVSGQKSTLEDRQLKLSSSEKKHCISSSSADKSEQSLNISWQKSTLEDQELKLSSSEKKQSVSSSSAKESDLNLNVSGQKSTLEDQELKLSSSEKKQQSVGSSWADKSDQCLNISGQKSTLEDQELKLSSSEKKQSVSLSSADESGINLNVSGHKSTLEDQELKLSSSEKKQSVGLSWADISDWNSKSSGQKSAFEDQELKLSSSEKEQNVGLTWGDISDWNLKNSDDKSTLEDQQLNLSLSDKKQSVSSSSSDKFDLNLKKSGQKSTLEDEQLKLRSSEKKLSVGFDQNSDQKSKLEDQELKLSSSEKKRSISSSSGNKSDHELESSDLKSTVEVQEMKLNLSEKRPSVSSSLDSSDAEENTSISAKPTSSSAKASAFLDKQSDYSNSKFPYSQNSMEDVSESMESEDSFDEYPNTQTSQDSIELFKEEDQQKNINGEGIYPADRLKKPNVLVNGHPIPDDLVKKAEKLAGSVLPGDYWYDYKAGFWGVMGNPCLGIIPPFIEEFNYPMPTNCAAGNTEVYVNGRELHQNDLDLLAGRGLPTTRDRSYIIGVSGRVADEDSGEELYYLGKLAPTIEKMKRGFGMKVPKSKA